jgi:hypothetical protein
MHTGDEEVKKILSQCLFLNMTIKIYHLDVNHYIHLYIYLNIHTGNEGVEKSSVTMPILIDEY